MNLGASRKNLVILGGLALVGGYLFYTNVLSDSPGASSPAARRAAPPPADLLAPGTRSAQGPVRRARVRETDEFRPSLKRRPEDKLDPTQIDPTLRLDLLAKVQSVDLEGGARNLFQFGPPPAPPLPKDVPKVVPKTPEQIALEKKQELEKAGPVKPPTLPIPLKYFGYSTVKGESRKKAFFLEGEEIYVATEGDVVKKRYRVVRIGVNSVVMEDTDNKSQQTLPLVEESVG